MDIINSVIIIVITIMINPISHQKYMQANHGAGSKVKVKRMKA